MAAPLDIGKLRHRVTVQTATTAANSVGQRKPTFATLGTYYALVECLGGAENANGDQLKGVLSYRVTMRAASVGLIKPTDQLTWIRSGVSRTLNVVAATVDPLNVMVVIDAVEKVVAA